MADEVSIFKAGVMSAAFLVVAGSNWLKTWRRVGHGKGCTRRSGASPSQRLALSGTSLTPAWKAQKSQFPDEFTGQSGGPAKRQLKLPFQFDLWGWAKTWSSEGRFFLGCDPLRLLPCTSRMDNRSRSAWLSATGTKWFWGLASLGSRPSWRTWSNKKVLIESK